MRLPLLALVLGLAGGAFSFTSVVSYDQVCVGSLGSCPSNLPPVYVKNQPYDFHVSISDPSGFVLDNGMYFIPPNGQGLVFSHGNAIQAATVRDYEASDCNATQYVNMYSTGLSGWPSQANAEWFSGDWYLLRPARDVSWSSVGMGQFITTANHWHNGEWKAICQEYQCSTGPGSTCGYPDLWIRTVVDTALADTCKYTSDAQCRICAWPYATRRSSTGCGCEIDRSKYQAQAQLMSRWYLYCNTYSDGTGRQYYTDASRTNLDASKGDVYAACSALPNSTVYVPVGSCPTGSRLSDTAASSDTSAQNAGGTVPRPPVGSGGGSGGSGSDTATHSRLDSIIGLLHEGDSGISHTDSLLSDMYDSMVGGPDTALIRLSLDSLDLISYVHKSRGDTSSAAGITLDSLMNICVPYGDSGSEQYVCTKDQPMFSAAVTTVRWFRRFLLILWGFCCIEVFLAIAKANQ